ncbi:hypothetical protein Hanom_Chr16g01419211 [Helianthus anomalus]
MEKHHYIRLFNGSITPSSHDVCNHPRHHCSSACKLQILQARHQSEHSNPSTSF